MHALRLKFTLLCLLGLLLAACSGHSPWSGKDSDNTGATPSAPQNIAVNAGDATVSLGWAAPATSSGNITYNIGISPSTTTALITVDGTSALIRGLNNNTTYTFSVTASNSNGSGPAASIQATPAKSATTSYTTIAISGDNDGISEPSLLRAANGSVWLTYSGVKTNNVGQINNSAIRIALSSNGGSSYARNIEVGTPANAQNICGTSCTGTWQYRTPWLIEDSTDPNAARRFKLFAHKYFFDTANGIPNYDVGTIVMWTASSPDGTWSQEQALLGWSTAFTTTFKIGTLDTSLQSCVWVGEGSATIYNNGIDIALSCAFDATASATRNIILLRSSDHLASLAYVATLLQPADAANYDADSFSAPTLLPAAGNAPVLLTTRIDTNGTTLGCMALPIANQNTGKLFNVSNNPLSILALAPLNDGGRCAWDRGLLSTGILMSDRTGNTFTLQATGKSL